MKNGHFISIAIAMMIGGVAGAYIDRYYLFGPIRATLDVGAFSTQLMKNSALLKVLKRGDIACAMKTLEGQLTVNLNGVEFYRSYQGANSNTLDRLEKSIEFAKDALQAREQSSAISAGKCV
ncbi:MAG: hypothetical protein KIT13_01635 [Burkholderiales bacterium]|nr:hypothetical protein [Burkholderiales bacterium]MCW5603060.1 hypothetical protein [Burkholderiales bacterium]